MVSFKDQALGQIYQMGFVHESLDSGIRHHIDALGIGPWYVAESFQMPHQTYRGTPTPDLDLTVAFSFLGDMMYELVVQKDAGPSVYRDMVDECGYGLHHIAYFTRSFDKESSRLSALGYERTFEVTTGPELGSKRVTYFDSRKHLGVMIELCEQSDPVFELFSRIKEACQGWRGEDPVRQLASLM